MICGRWSQVLEDYKNSTASLHFISKILGVCVERVPLLYIVIFVSPSLLSPRKWRCFHVARMPCKRDYSMNVEIVGSLKDSLLPLRMSSFRTNPTHWILWPDTVLFFNVFIILFYYCFFSQYRLYLNGRTLVMFYEQWTRVLALYGGTHTPNQFRQASSACNLKLYTATYNT